MTYKLSELLQDILLDMGQLRVSVATGGSTTTVVDSKLATAGSTDDDAWNKSTLFIVRDAGGAEAAPHGEFQFVSDYVGSTGTFTVDPFTAAIGSGDVFAWSSEYFPVFNMIEIANAGLKFLGDISLVDSTTLDSAASQTEYVGAVAWKRKPPFMIEIQGRTGDSNDNKWTTISNWKYVPAAAGTGATIEFREQPLAGRDLRIWYMDTHPDLTAFDSVIHETIHPKLAFAAATEGVLQWQNARLEGNNNFWMQKLNDAKDRLEIAKQKYKIWQPPKQVSGIKLGIEQYQYSGESSRR